MLFIMNCGTNKAAGERAAFVKYDSRQHRAVAEAFWNERYALGDRLLFLSAEFGLLEATAVVPDYERKIDAARSRELASSPEQLAIMLENMTDDRTVIVFGGKLYRDTIARMLPSLDAEAYELVGDGRGCGDHFSALKDFLAADADGLSHGLKVLSPLV